ncbi:MAG TPA: hypothetical protein VM737_04670, partial [Gemmatimonadota bacterium]|nr:hypothetical protein [Gemmatimonadota bacterium]
PLCKATILESASVCPACRHHLRFDPQSTKQTWSSFSSLRVEGTIHHPPSGEPWEYSVTLTIRDDEGEEILRQVVGVGAFKPSEERTFTVEVEVLTPVTERPMEERSAELPSAARE